MSERFKRDDFERLSTYFIASEAQKLKLDIKKVFPDTKKSILEISIDSQKYILIGQRSPFISFSAYQACKNKSLTKRLLQDAGIPTPDGAAFVQKDRDKALNYVEQLAKPIVVKPLDGLHGNDVFLGISSLEEAKHALAKIFDKGQRVLIEQQVTGIEYRVLATRRQLLSVIQRIPANVVGDGTHTIGQLIDIKNSDPDRGDYSCALIEIKKDDSLLTTIKKSGYTLEAIPPVGEVVSLRATSNLSAGGDSVDVSEKAHANMKKIAPAIIKAIPGLPFGGIDFMIEDIALDPLNEPYAVIEVNSSPMLSMHHEPYEGAGRNVAHEIVKEMMAEACQQSL